MFSVVLFGAMVVSSQPAVAQQLDAPYYEYQKRNVERWAQEDRQVNQKLADLEERFGKKLGYQKSRRRARNLRRTTNTTSQVRV